MNKSWLSFFAAFLSLAISLGAAEWLARRYLPEVNDSHVIRIRDVLEIHHHPVTLREPLPEPDPDALRIMFLGDSFTWGSCGPEETFPRLVETYFKNGAVPGVAPRNVQVFNLGVVSYSPSIYGILAKEYLPKLKPHLVVIAVDDSDPQDDLLYARTMVKDAQGLAVSARPYLEGVPKWMEPLAYHIKLLRLSCSVLQQRIGSRFLTPDEIRQKDLLSFANRYEHYKPEKAKKWEPAFKATGDLLLAIDRYIRSQGSLAVILNYPYAPLVTRDYCIQWRKQFNLGADKLYDPAFHAFLRGFAQANKIPYYDFTPAMKGMPDLEGMFWEENGHYSGKANAVFAREIVRFIAPLMHEGARL